MSNNTALIPFRGNAVRNRVKAGLSSLLAFLAVAALLAYAVIGPSGLIALSDHRAALDQRKAELLDPNNIDPDLGGELIRKELGVAAPDEIVIPLN
jgi:hypothetical protein